MAMARVTYLGPSLSLRHGPGNTKYDFLKGRPYEVPFEVGMFYEDESTRGGPWIVDYTYGERFKRAFKT